MRQAAVPGLSAQRLLRRLSELEAKRALATLEREDWPAAEDPFPLSDQYRLWEIAVDASGQRSLPLDIATEYDLATYDVLGFACATAPRMEDALERLSSYIRLWVTGESMTFERTAGGAVLAFHHALPPSRGRELAVESSLAKILHAARLGTGVRLLPVVATFAHSGPEDDGPHRGFFGEGLRFDASANELHFAAADTALPLLRADADFSAYFQRVADSMLGAKAPTSAAMRVREHVERSLRDAHETGIAKQLGWSCRTLRRRLADDGTDFRSVLDDVRREHALRSMRDGASDLDGLAQTLGFSGKRSLYRAFKRWTGETPVSYRRRSKAS